MTSPRDLVLEAIDATVTDDNALFAGWARAFRASLSIEDIWLSSTSIDALAQQIDVDLDDGGTDIDAAFARLYGDLARVSAQNGPVGRALRVFLLRQALFQVDSPRLGQHEEFNSRRFDVFFRLVSALDAHPDLRAGVDITNDEWDHLVESEESPSDSFHALVLFGLGEPSKAAWYGGAWWNEAAEILRRVSARTSPLEKAVAGYLERNPSDKDASLAYGTVLAISGRAAEALPYLDAADLQFVPTELDARYMYVDCCSALGVVPKRTMADAAESMLVNWNWEGGWRNLGGEEELAQPLINGLLVEAGKTVPVSREGSIPRQSRRTASKGQDAVLAEIMAGIKRLDDSFHLRAEALITSSERTYRFVEAQIARTDFLQQQISELLPQTKRDSIARELSGIINCWQDLSPWCQQQLITARYLSEDAALGSPDSSSAIVMAACSSLEVAGRELLKLGTRMGLGDIVHCVEEQAPSASILPSLRRVLHLRNVAAHGLRELKLSDAEQILSAVIGSTPGDGLLDGLVTGFRAK